MHGILISLALTLALASCGKSQEAGSVRMQFSVTVPAGLDSDMMRMFLYDRGTGRNSGEIFLSQRNGETFTKTSTLRSGNYDVLGYNFDIPDTFLRGERDENTLEIYTKPVGSEIRRRFLLDDNTAVVYSPDRVVAARSSVSVKGGEDAFGASATDLTETWSIEIKAEGAQYALASGCMLSGEKISLKPFSEGDSVTGNIYFDLARRSDLLCADFNTFGHSGSDDIVVTIFVNNGTEVYNFSKSIKDIVADAKRTGVRKLAVSGSIVIPAPKVEPGTGGGFTPNVGEWQQENSEILI